MFEFSGVTPFSSPDTQRLMESSGSAGSAGKEDGTLLTMKAQQSAASSPPDAGPNESFLNRLSSNISAYAVACRKASSLSDWMDINNRYLGSSFLYTDEIGTGLIFGYCAGYALNRALKLGALLCGIGFISLQVLPGCILQCPCYGKSRILRCCMTDVAEVSVCELVDRTP